jgi:hypothetical protein
VTAAAIAGTVGSAQDSRYLAAGSSQGEAAMANQIGASAAQQTAPMSRMLTIASCSYNRAAPGANGGSLGNASGIVIGLEAIDVVASTASGGSAACSTPASNAVTGDGLAASGSAVFGPAGNQTSASQSWKHVLALVYGGLDLTTGTVDCNSAARRNLVNNWGNLFQNTCNNPSAVCGASVGITGNGDGVHAGQLMHAFRPGDGSAIVGIFASLLGLDVQMPAPSASSNNGFGASPYCNALNWDTSAPNNGGTSCNLGGHDQFVGPGGVPDPKSSCTFTSFKPLDLALNNDTNPDCAAGTHPGAGNHRMPPPHTLGADPLVGSRNGADVLPTSFQDNDPIRRPCVGVGTASASATGGAAFLPGDSVCNLDGNLGLVLSIPSSEFVPTSLGKTQYPTNKCTAFTIGAPSTYLTCAPYSAGVHNGECPNGDALNSAGCVIPIDTAHNTSLCVSDKTPATVIKNTAARPGMISDDERVFNFHMRDGSMIGAPAYIKQVVPNGTGGFATIDFAGGMGRIHSLGTIYTQTGADNPPNVGCQLLDASDQIACLVQADPCSIGLAGDGAKAWTARATGGSPDAARANGTVCDNLVAAGVCAGATGGPYSGASCPAGCTGGAPTDAIRIAGTYPTSTMVTNLGRQANEYALANKLYLNSIVGFAFLDGGGTGQADTAIGGELDVASWESSPANMAFALPAAGYFPLGGQSLAAFNQPYCEDFNERLVCAAGTNAKNACNSNAGATMPAGAAGFTPNHGVAVPSDPSPGTGPGQATTSTICGNGTVEPYEECDPGAGATAGTATCSLTCRCAGGTAYRAVGGVFGCN